MAKIRSGFVSNSSSSSFLIYGTRIDNSEINKMFFNDSFDWECVDLKSSLYDIVKEKNLNLMIIRDSECETVYFGNSWSSVKDEETGKQFKERTESDIKKLLNDNTVKCSTLNFEIYN